MSSGSFDLLGRLVSLLVTVSQWWGALVDLAEKLNSDSGESWGRELSMFLRKEPTWIRRWYEKDGVIYFEVTSNSRTGPEWIEYMEKKGFRLSKWSRDILLSQDFKPTNGVTYKVAVLKGTLFTDSNRITKKIRAEAERRKLEKLPVEVACLIRDAFSDKELEDMDLWRIVVFHEAIKNSVGDPFLLAAFRGSGGRWLFAYCGGSGDGWCSGDGFAFAVSQVSLN